MHPPTMFPDVYVCGGIPAPSLMSTRSIRPSEADYPVYELFIFYGVRFLASRPTPNLEGHGIPLRLGPTP
jgi:hypothetical protein